MTLHHPEIKVCPKISIIIVTYNVVNILQNCLNSIYKQRYPSLEIVIIDGGSIDGTVEILSTNENNIHFWKSEKDEGIYNAMNKGLKYITGDWVYFLGADDELFEDFSSLAYALKDPDTIYYGSVLKNGEKYLGELTPYQHAKTGICHQAVIYPASVFTKYNFHLKYPISADHVLNMECWNDYNFKFHFLDLVIAKYNHEGISSVKKDALFEKHKASLILKNYGRKIWGRFLFRKLKHKLK
ncbi:MAG TPA: glycosyltransferase family 2 protein [Sphingobacteriaceae bacterium]|nr:glycosyltransferase family 2 protein [Sphingobacteriaceae bacterium]